MKIFTIGETRDGKLRNVSFELLTAARKIAADSEVTTALIGCDDSSLASELGNFGADKIYVVADDALTQYTMEGYTSGLYQLTQEINPDVILFGHTAIGKDVAPRLAARLGIGLASDITNIELNNETARFTRPIYAGKAFQKIEMNEDKWILTIRPNNIEALPVKSEAKPTVIEYKPTVSDIRTVIKDIVKKMSEGVDLSEAKVVVAGGRGVKSAEGFEPLQKLARLLGGAVGASRGACDADYCDYSLQIGQTGKVVTPDLYIACGISGAIQHVAGMSQSKVVIAINKDPEAPIFGIADYGIVGDLFEVVPMLTEELKKILESNS